MDEELRFNGRERSSEKRRAFVCRLTDGRFAVIVEGAHEDTPPLFFPDIASLKRSYALLVSDHRVPLYEDTELLALQHRLERTSPPTAA